MATIQVKTGSGVPGTALSAGEPAFDTTNHILYIGDGTTNTPIGASLTSIVPYTYGGTNTNTAWTPGSILYTGSSTIVQDNAALYWDGDIFIAGLAQTTGVSGFTSNETATISQMGDFSGNGNGTSFNIDDSSQSMIFANPSSSTLFYGGVYMGKAGAYTGLLNFGNATGSNYVGINAPASTSAWVLTLPGTAGTSGYPLLTDGTGISSWTQLGSTGLASNAVTYTKIQAGSTHSLLLGTPSSGSAYQEITLGSGLAMTSGVLSATGTGGTVTSVTGTTNQIDVATGTSTPVISLHSGGTLPGAWALGTPASGVLTNATGYPGDSSLVTVGTITTGVWHGTAIANGNLANSSVTVNGTAISLGASGTVTAAAGTLTGTTLNSTVVTSSLTSVGTIATGIWNGTRLTSSYIPTDVAYLDVQQSFTKGQAGAVVTLTDNPTIAVDLSLANNYTVVLGGNRVLGTPTNIVAGQAGSIQIWQDSAGSRTLTYNWMWQFANQATPSLSTGIYNVDELIYEVLYYGTNTTVTTDNATPSVLTWTGHGMVSGQLIQFPTGAGTTPAVNVTYFVHVINANTFHIASTFANLQAGTYLHTVGIGGNMTAVTCSIQSWLNQYGATTNLTGVVTSVGTVTSFGSFTSATLATALTDETGSGSAVFATSPTLVTPLLGTPTSGNLVNCTFPTLNQNTTGTANIAGGTLGAIPYQSGAGATSVLAATATANKILLSGASAAPVWSTPTFPNASATTRKKIVSDGTNWVASTETWAVPGTSRNILISDGTNWASTTLASGDIPNNAASTTGSAATLTTARNIGGVSFNGSASITVATATGGFTVTGGALTAPACTASIPSINIPSGTVETTPAVGDIEFDGVQFYATIDSTSKRGQIPVKQYVHLTANGGAITTIANFFGSTTNISLVASAYYFIEIHFWYVTTGTGAVTFTLTNSSAPTSQNIFYEMSPTTGIVAPPGTATMLTGQINNDATAARTIITGSLSAATHYAHCKIWLKNGSGTSLKVQATAGGTNLTPQLGSMWSCERISPNNIGTFAA